MIVRQLLLFYLFLSFLFIIYKLCGMVDWNFFYRNYLNDYFGGGGRRDGGGFRFFEEGFLEMFSMEIS